MRSSRFRIGLAISGGGARSLAAIGCLESLENHGIRPHVVSGCSGGALVALASCSGKYSPAEITEILEREFYGGWWTKLPTAKTLRLLRLVRGKLVTMMKRHLGPLDFADLATPLVVTATDLNTGQSVALNQGSVYEALQASISLPVLARPFAWDDTFLVDGAYSENLPSAVLTDVCDYIIGIDVVGRQPRPLVRPPSHLRVARRCRAIQWNRLREVERQPCDFVRTVSPPCSFYDVQRIREIVEAGRQCMDAAMNQLISSIEAARNAQQTSPNGSSSTSLRDAFVSDERLGF